MSNGGGGQPAGGDNEHCRSASEEQFKLCSDSGAWKWEPWLKLGGKRNNWLN